VAPQTDKKSLEQALAAYNKVFSDAFICEQQPMKGKIISRATSVQKPEKDSFLDKIKHKTLYLCFDGDQTKKQKAPLKIVFEDKRANVFAINGDTPPITLGYQVKENKLYLYKEGRFNASIYHIPEKATSEYLLISKWVKHKKQHMMRYYFDLQEAEKYIENFHRTE
jgi:hypothetical protein